MYSREVTVMRTKKIWQFVVFSAFPLLTLFLMIFYQRASQTVQSIMEGALISLGTSFIVLLVTEYILKDTTQVDQIQKNIDVIKETIIVSEDIKRYGIQSIKNISYEDDSDAFWLDLLRSTEEKLYIMAHSLSPWFQEKYEEEFFKTIQSLLSQQKEVKMVILMPSGKNLEYMNVGNTEDYSNKLKTTVAKLTQFLNSLSVDQRRFFQVKLNGSFLMPYTYIRNEKQILISPYFFSGKERSNFMITFDHDSVFSDSFNNDYNELFANNSLIPLTTMTLIQKVESKGNAYSASNWVYEDTYKYVFSCSEAIYEVGYYIHYNREGGFVDRTIELPSSYGCPFKCKYCASSQINSFKIIGIEELKNLVNSVFQIHRLSREETVHITFTGTGDFYFTKETVIPAIKALIAEYPNTIYTISSCAWNEGLIQYVKESGLGCYFKNLQMTYISDDTNKTKSIIPNYIELMTLPDLVESIKKSGITRFRVNYLMIKNVNDSDNDFNTFLSGFAVLKEQITIRISRLNETNSSRRNGIEPATQERLQAFCGMCKDQGYAAYVFSSEKNDNMNCGQLITEGHV